MQAVLDIWNRSLETDNCSSNSPYWHWISGIGVIKLTTTLQVFLLYFGLGYLENETIDYSVSSSTINCLNGSLRILSAFLLASWPWISETGVWKLTTVLQLVFIVIGKRSQTGVRKLTNALRLVLIGIGCLE